MYWYSWDHYLGTYCVGLFSLDFKVHHRKYKGQEDHVITNFEGYDFEKWHFGLTQYTHDLDL